MKKIYLVIPCFGVLFLFSCGNNTTEQKSNAKDVIKTEVLEENKPTERNEEGKDYLKLGSELTEKESFGSIKKGLSYDSVIVLLGAPDKKSKQELWGADGYYHQTLEWPKKGIVLDMAGESKGKGTVWSISITGPCTLKTKQNIGIGSTTTEVEKAYRDLINPEETTEELIVAGSIYEGLMFTCKNKIVTMVYLGAGAE